MAEALKRMAAVLVVLVLCAPPLIAFESHTVSVTARIEHPLQVDPTRIELTECGGDPLRVSVELADSFGEQDRLGGVEYRLVIEADAEEDAPEPLCLRDPAEEAEEEDSLEAASLSVANGDAADIWLVSLGDDDDSDEDDSDEDDSDDDDSDEECDSSEADRSDEATRSAEATSSASAEMSATVSVPTTSTESTGAPSGEPADLEVVDSTSGEVYTYRIWVEVLGYVDAG